MTTANTEQRIYNFLANEQFFVHYDCSEFPFTRTESDHVARIMRMPFTTTNLYTVSIQQGNSHYTRSFDTVEVWNFPVFDNMPKELSIFEETDEPIGHLPISTLAKYIDWLESLPFNKTN
jgi:hypothetical protein